MEIQSCENKKQKTVRGKGSREVKDIQKENNEGIKKKSPTIRVYKKEKRAFIFFNL